MKRKTPPRKPQPICTSVRFDPINLEWVRKKADLDKRKVGPFLNLLITQLREKEAKP